MAKTEVDFMAADVRITGVEVASETFKVFTERVAEATAMKTPTQFETRLRRVRLLRQVTYFAGDTKQALTLDQILQIPIPEARKIVEAIDAVADANVAGKIANDADGISAPIRFELGTPIKMKQGKETIEISELEFQAKTYGDLEDVMSAADPLSQTNILLATTAKPVYPTLVSMPSWALDQLTLADGVTIAQTVLPRFLE